MVVDGGAGLMDDTVTPDDLAARYGVSVRYVADQCRRGRWPHLRVGRTYRFTSDQVGQIDRIQTVQATQEHKSADSWGRRTRSNIPRPTKEQTS